MSFGSSIILKVKNIDVIDFSSNIEQEIENSIDLGSCYNHKTLEWVK